MARTFEDLVAEAESAPIDGWDFSWLDGRATEQRPSWGYQRQLSQRLANATAALDLETGGGEVLAGAGNFPPTTAATESWPPNLALATKLLHPLGVVVVATGDAPVVPFADDAFDLVTCRHPSKRWWTEIARVLRPGGIYFAQHVGPGTLMALREHFLGPQPRTGTDRYPDVELQRITGAGLEVVNLQMERLRVEFFDIGAVIYFLRKVIWLVPDFTVEHYYDRLRALHERIQAGGPFVTYSTRVLIEAHKPS
ncbi:class I SAM-dependent methyltransferase [Mycobacterium lacus]|nr:class I SAM-dependent methyltransferase [Mycobacterium lacus]MCV7125687.1 methyltransferase domain-containing protein [Mycobacterium lacus]ORV98881.1 methyltransferase type 11 [Mycobacterium lacus]